MKYARGESGITQLEVLVAVVLFTFVILATANTVIDATKQIGISEVRAQATAFAVEELERVRLLPYEEIESISAGPVPEAPNYTRSVQVTTVGGEPAAIYDYRLITVTVETPTALEPVSVTTALAESENAAR